MEFTCCHSNGIGTNSDFHPSAGLSLNPFKLTVGGFDKSIASKMQIGITNYEIQVFLPGVSTSIVSPFSN